MSYIFITLGVVSIVLFLLSFFMNDKFKHMEDQHEQFSISTIQDIYQMKKKIKILEEELLSEELGSDWKSIPVPSSSSQPAMAEKIRKMHNMGMKTKEISQKTSLSESDVRSILFQAAPARGVKS